MGLQVPLQTAISVKFPLASFSATYVPFNPMVGINVVLKLLLDMKMLVAYRTNEAPFLKAGLYRARFLMRCVLLLCWKSTGQKITKQKTRRIKYRALYKPAFMLSRHVMNQGGVTRQVLSTDVAKMFLYLLEQPLLAQHQWQSLLSRRLWWLQSLNALHHSLLRYVCILVRPLKFLSNSKRQPNHREAPWFSWGPTTGKMLSFKETAAFICKLQLDQWPRLYDITCTP